MDKYEYNLRIDQIREAVEKRDIDTAVKIADEIDLKKEKEVSVFIILADAYELNKDYKKAKEVLLMAYEKSQAGRQLAYRLAILAAKTKEFDEAEEFYQDFVEMAPRDTARYVLRYRIAKEKKEPIENLIEILEEYVDLDMEEKWMYELARLYHLAGDEEKCVELCDEMSLWFSHGKYVRRALDLKKKYRPLTKRQEENYNKTDEDIVPAVESNAVTKTENKENVQPADMEGVETKKPATIPFTTMKADGLKNKHSKDKAEKEVSLEDTVPIPGEIDIEDIHLKPLQGDGSDAIDLQAEIAKNMREIMNSEEEMAQIKAENEAKPDKLSMTLDPLYKYDADGQIGLDIEEPEQEEKQITGQLSIEEVLRNLEERGILKADTVNKTVETMDQAAEVVDKAAEEAAIKAEEKKENETIVQDLEIKDLSDDGEMEEVRSALESYADDAANGFVFTDQIDSEAIEKVLQDKGAIPMPDMDAEEVPMAEINIDVDAVKISDITGLENFEVKDNIIGKVKEGEPVKDILAETQDEELVKDILAGTEESDINRESGMDIQESKPEKESVGDIENVKTVSDVPDNTSDAGFEKDLSGYTKEEHNDEDSIGDTKSFEIPKDVILKKDDMKPEENVILDIADSEPVELSDDIPVLDLSFEVPVKKLHTSIAPDSEPVPANTASLKELFADLDEATKREIGILEEEERAEKKVSEETESSKETILDDVAVSHEEEPDKGDNISKEENIIAETDEGDNSKENNSEVEETPEVHVQTDANINQSMAAVSSDLSDNQKTTEVSDVDEETNEGSETEKAHTSVSDMLQVKVSTNTNLSQTMSLNLDKIIVTDEEMQPFESFKSVNGLEQKIKDTVTALAASYTASGNSRTGNIMILGDDKSGKTTMAIELIKLINRKRGRTGRRIAKVDSSVLNSRGIRSSMKKLMGSDLIVENAQHLRKSILNEFLAVAQYYTDDMLMVFEGETSALKTMRNENEDIAEMFDHVLVIKEYDVKEWVAYAKKYAGTKNYMIDEMGTLALYKSIDDFYSKHQGIDQSDVENIVNRAIKKAGTKVTRKFTNLFSGKNDDTGMDILKESDFK